MTAVNQEAQAYSVTWKCTFRKAMTALPPNLGSCLINPVAGLPLILWCSTEDYNRSVSTAQGSVFGAVYYLPLFNIGAVTLTVIFPARSRLLHCRFFFGVSEAKLSLPPDCFQRHLRMLCSTANSVPDWRWERLEICVFKSLAVNILALNLELVFASMSKRRQNKCS
jgi:hypothetical protein